MIRLHDAPGMDRDTEGPQRCTRCRLDLRIPGYLPWLPGPVAVSASGLVRFAPRSRGGDYRPCSP